MANKRITQLPTAPQVEDNDYLAIDNTSTPTAENDGGTRKIKASEVGDKVATENPSPTDYGEYAILATYSDVSEEKTKDKTRKTDFLYNATNQKIVARGAYDTTTYCDNEIGLSHSRANEDDKFQILPSGIWATASDSDVVAGLTVDDTTHEGYGVVSKYEEDESSSTTTKSTQKYNKFTLEKTYEDWDAEEVTVLESLEMSTDDIETSKTWDGTNTSLKDALRVNDVKGTVENAQIATFTDGSPLPMPKLEIAVEPQQSGSGDPSPENIRPIIGWSAVDVNVSGANVWDEEWESGGLDSSGNNVPDATRIRSKNYISIIPMVSYFFKSSTTVGLRYYDKNKTFIAEKVIYNAVVTTPSEAYYMRFVVVNTATYNNDISINYPSTDTEYHAYNPNSETITIQLGSTYYGGKLDVVSGVLSAVPYYASYNGETLVGEWISDRDKYEVGTTPTIGAQVVNIGATPATIQLTPTQVSSLLGSNNVWANTGNIIKLEYIRDLNITINELIQRIENLEG